MNWHRTNTRAAAFIAAAIVIVFSHPAGATVIDFNGIPAGSILGGAPGGDPVLTAPITGFTVTCINNGGGPNSAIVFDSQNPTGGDADLGTPNIDFGGPGVGIGGTSGKPGENDITYGNLLIIAENVIDTNRDELVDDPDDEAGGGVIVIDFEQAVIVVSVVMVDIDGDEVATIRLYSESGILATIPAQSLGNNSIQTLNGGGHTGVHRMEIELSSSGAIGEIEYILDTTPVAESTWGGIKAAYTR
jgi:hypothetical protein